MKKMKEYFYASFPLIEKEQKRKEEYFDYENWVEDMVFRTIVSVFRMMGHWTTWIISDKTDKLCLAKT